MRRLLRRAQGTLLLGSLTLGLCYLYCFQYGVFGAKVDWISQHSVLPDYFRQQFYETGELFPEFAANIGGGQNIYNFSYYGLYNPLLLPSYLLPSVKMSDYMMAVQFLCLTASVLLMYWWLKKKGFSEKICVGVSVLFLLSGPLIFHSYNQIMFVNYMPFLLTGLLGVDRYFKKNKKAVGRQGGMLTTGIFLMIMTSFYFSIGGMLVLVIYGVHRWLMVCDEGQEKVTVKAFLAEGIRFAFHFLAAVMLSGILLVPAAFALTGREGTETAVRLKELLIPEISMTRFCYSPYGIGMASIAVTALIALLLRGKCCERVLAVSCVTVLTVPVFAYLLNGGLYVRDKVMIPFLPLLCYILAYYLEGLEHMEGKEGSNYRFPEGLLPYVLTIGLIYMSRRQGDLGDYWKPLILDSIVMLVSFLIFMLCRRRWGNSMILLTPAVLMLGVFGYACHTQADRMLDRKFYSEVTDADIGEQISKVTGGEEGFYRTEQLGNADENAANLNRIWDMGQYISSIYSSSCHGGYQKFRKETFQLEEPFRNFLMQSAVHNPVYQRFMGVKYVVSRTEVPGYDAVEQCAGQNEGNARADKKNDSEWKVYENDQVSPIAYATDRVINEEAYRRLEFPCNQLALLKYAVVQETAGAPSSRDDGDFSDDKAGEGVNRIQLDLPETIDSDTDEKFRIDLPDPQQNEEEREGEKVLFLQFQIENLKPSTDVAVWAEGIRNKLTARNHFYYNENTEFTYAVPLQDDQHTIEMTFGKGHYEIRNVRAYTGVLPVREEKGGLYQSEFQADREKTKGNRIEGTIYAESPGYFITTIPYDENFEILADGKRVEAEVVNTAFLGFEIEAGKHEISIVYHAPGVKAGKMMSIAGVLMMLAVIAFDIAGGGCHKNLILKNIIL